MAKTTNLQLNLTTDEETKFRAWRKTIDGNNDVNNKSNFQKIDEAFGNLPNTYYNKTETNSAISSAKTEVKNQIPTKTSQLSNDSDFVKSSNLSTVATSGNYEDLKNAYNTWRGTWIRNDCIEYPVKSDTNNSLFVSVYYLNEKDKAGLPKVSKVSTNSVFLNDYTTVSNRYYQVEAINGYLVVNVPFEEGYSKTEIDQKFGNIDNILDAINGEVL